MMPGMFLLPQGVSPLPHGVSLWHMGKAQSSRTGSVLDAGEETVAEHGVSFVKLFFLR